MLDATFVAIRTAAHSAGRDSAVHVLDAFRCGMIQDNDISPDDVCGEYCNAGDYACDILPGVIPEAWAAWVETGDVDAMGEAWALYVAFFAEGFAGYVWAYEGEWAVALGCV